MKKMSIRFLLLTVLALLLTAIPAYAKEDELRGRENEIRQENSQNQGQVENKVKIKVEREAEEDEGRLEVRGDRFEIRGRITALSENNLTIGDQVIIVSPLKVSNFQERGIIAVGKVVKVEGIIVDNTKFAREITIFDPEAEKEMELEIRDEDDIREDQVDIRAGDPVEDLNRLLQQILDFLKNLGR